MGMCYCSSYVCSADLYAPAGDRHAAVALLGGRIAEPGLVTGRQEVGVQPGRAGQLVLLGLVFLHAQQVGVLGGEPVEETLACRGTHAVGVEADDAHWWELGMRGIRGIRGMQGCACLPSSRLCGNDAGGDRKSVVEGQSVSVRVAIGGRRIIKKTKS